MPLAQLMNSLKLPGRHLTCSKNQGHKFVDGRCAWLLTRQQDKTRQGKTPSPTMSPLTAGCSRMRGD